MHQVGQVLLATKAFKNIYMSSSHAYNYHTVFPPHTTFFFSSIFHPSATRRKHLTLEFSKKITNKHCQKQTLPLIHTMRITTLLG